MKQQRKNQRKPHGTDGQRDAKGRARVSPSEPASHLGRAWVVAAMLFLITCITFWPVRNHDFVTYDDLKHVQNLHVQAGLTGQSIAWAFTTSYMSNWHPVTWLSHMIDVELFGAGAGGPHMVNVFIHAANAALLLLLLTRMTGAMWRSALAATLFALHSLHVESVAWVAERKDVLSTLFGLLAIWAYVDFVGKRSAIRYTFVMMWFSLSLMSKPMLVTLPCLFLLLDYWPLRRLNLESATATRQVILEKIPLLGLALISSLITFVVQQRGGAMELMQPVPLGARIANACVSYVLYLRDAVWPAKLAVLYPHPIYWPVSWVIGSLIALAVITFGSYVLRLKRPYLMVGWLWYLGTLVPVIGFVQVGEQARADRYTYVPLIGIFIMIAWSVPASWSGVSPKALRIGNGIAAAVLSIALMAATRSQLGHWENSRTLYERALAVTDANYTAQNNLGHYLALQGRIDEAFPHFLAAVAINPKYPEAYANIGDVYATRGEVDAAIESYRQALALDPTMPVANVGIAAAYFRKSNFDAAIQHFEIAMMRDPQIKNIQFNLGLLYAATGQLEKSLRMFEAAQRREPHRTDVVEQMARVRAAIEQGRRR